MLRRDEDKNLHRILERKCDRNRESGNCSVGRLKAIPLEALRVPGSWGS